MEINECVSINNGEEFHKIVLCHPEIGVSIFVYEDSNCVLPVKGASANLGCPKGGCCHKIGEGSQAIPYTLEVESMVGSKFGFGFFNAIT